MLMIRELKNDSTSIDDAKKIYFNSFPEKEQLPFSILKDNVELGKASFSGLFFPIHNSLALFITQDMRT